MKFLPLFLALCMASQTVVASELPDLGEVSQTAFTAADEARVGSEIMRDIYADPQYYDDPELIEYLNNLGYRLVASSSENRRAFRFFVLKDPTLNAFALPGGFIGVHTGLIEAAQSESELAGVLGHEIAHVTQHHLARMIESQKQGIVPSLAALALAILAARSNPQIATAAIATVQAGTIQQQLNFSRDNEREADRIGMQIMSGAGFDPNAMSSFFERLQKDSRLYENNAPAYLRTHPLTSQRIADIQNRAANLPTKQVPDSLDFQLLRAKLKAQDGSADQAVKAANAALMDGRYNNVTAARYGLVAALLRDQQYSRAGQEMQKLRALNSTSPLIDTLAARLKLASGDSAGALKLYQDARERFPGYRPLLYANADALLQARQDGAALKLVEAAITLYPDDYRLQLLLARGYAQQGKVFMSHKAQADAYFYQGQLDAAIEQLRLALKSKDGDFYQSSIAEARLKQWLAIEKPPKP
jgi:predicted Zn-dependent protease